MTKLKKKKKPILSDRARVRVFAPSSVVSRPELILGAGRIEASGLTVEIDPQCFEQDLFFAGTDSSRAQALIRAIRAEEVGTLWAARGGYGSARLLPILKKAFPKKSSIGHGRVYVGYSDSTALMDFLNTHLGFSILHAPMPGLRGFCRIEDEAFDTLISCVLGETQSLEWKPSRQGLKRSGKISSPIQGAMIGGNLSTFLTLMGTEFAPQMRGSILFLEDTSEPLYRIDRMVQHLIASGACSGVRAVVLGDFDDLSDPVSQGLKKLPQSLAEAQRLIFDAKPKDLAPLRKTLSKEDQVSEEVFDQLLIQPFLKLGVPVLSRFPAGHSKKGQAALPLGFDTRYAISPRGEIELLEWSGWDSGG
jgi:muramoyltetrapeptide carboxypeptidase